MSDCPCTSTTWLWGDFIACLDCGARYISPREALQLRREQQFIEDASGE